jgi:hypothetical protein
MFIKKKLIENVKLLRMLIWFKKDGFFSESTSGEISKCGEI